MNEFKVKDFYDLVVRVLEEITSEVVAENPNAESVFPCLVVQSPVRYDERNGESIPILSRFTITVEAWTKRKTNSMALIDKVDSKLRGYNFTRVGTPIDLYDEITKCYRYGGNYEVFYNAVSNVLEKIK